MGFGDGERAKLLPLVKKKFLKIAQKIYSRIGVILGCNLSLESTELRKGAVSSARILRKIQDRSGRIMGHAAAKGFRGC